MPKTWDQSGFYRYHESTKHTYASVYSSRWFLDWENQPNPFRIYEGAPVIDLPIPRRPPTLDYLHLPVALEYPPSWSLESISQLLFYSMALSAWKQIPGTTDRWSLRVNPSSGNLHPTETHLIIRNVTGLEDGVYHFRVDHYCLEARYQGDVDGLLNRMNEICSMPCGDVTLVLTSIFWREAWKYRERAFRYCHHDLGHALGSITEALRALGYTSRFCHLFDDPAIESLMELTGGDEHPGLIITTTPARTGGSETLPKHFMGQPNVLSAEEFRFRKIEDIYEATRHWKQNSSTLEPAASFIDRADIALRHDYHSNRDFWEVVRKRRSAVAMDGQTGLFLDPFGAILYRATQGAQGDILKESPGSSGQYLIHLFIYAHRVEGLSPGLYYYNRRDHVLALLKEGDVREAAAALSLHQNIASDGVFAVSMMADFPRAYEAFGERGYRAVHIEAGFIGQGLYLGAESAGTNATGIGAFFDDDVNRYLDAPRGLEVIYHFTVGRGVEDPRIQMTHGYGWEIRSGL